MKLKDFKEMISSIPEDFDEYDVIYSEIEDNDEESYVRYDDLLVGMISDDGEKKMCFMADESYKIALSLYDETEDEEENNEEDDDEEV